MGALFRPLFFSLGVEGWVKVLHGWLCAVFLWRWMLSASLTSCGCTSLCLNFFLQGYQKDRISPHGSSSPNHSIKGPISNNCLLRSLEVRISVYEFWRLCSQSMCITLVNISAYFPIPLTWIPYLLATFLSSLTSMYTPCLPSGLCPILKRNGRTGHGYSCSPDLPSDLAFYPAEAESGVSLMLALPFPSDIGGQMTVQSRAGLLSFLTTDGPCGLVLAGSVYADMAD